MNTRAINAGVGAIVGFDFQRNVALYLLLKNYKKFNDKDFFICIEHHDDFLFGFYEKDTSHLEKVWAYQAKKMSSNNWNINNKFIEIISKILEVGNNLIQDEIVKSINYSHELNFISNREIKLKNISKVLIVDEKNPKLSYKNVHDSIKEKIEEQLKIFCSTNEKFLFEEQLDNFYINFIEFGNTSGHQRVELIGTMHTEFPNIVDSEAALDTLMEVFRKVESTYNENNKVSLLDVSKRVESDKIKQAIEIIQDYQKTYEIWRSEARELGKHFRINLAIQREAEQRIKNTFDFFKDLNNFEHQQIRTYIKNNDYSRDYYDYTDLIAKYMEDIYKNYEINLDQHDVFFSCLCAYVEFWG